MTSVMASEDSNDSVELPTSALGGEFDGHVDYVSNGFDGNGQMEPELHEPVLMITEQPQPRGFRFRYISEGTSHGGLQGVNASKGKNGRKSFPSVAIMNYRGPARIVVTLVTDEDVPKVHAHELVGKSCQNGICVVELKGNTNMTATFPNLGIRHATKKNVVKILEDRIQESMRLQSLFTTMAGPIQQPHELSDEDKEKAKKQAKAQASSMKLNAVRLCFQAYLMDANKTFGHMLPSVVSDTIYDSKASDGSSLKICRMDRQAGSCTGGDEVFLLCDKVKKDDISVRFFQIDNNDELCWEGFGEFGPQDVHRQYAIVFRTPPYGNTDLQKEVVVQLELRRTSDGEASDPKPFTFYPKQQDKDGVDKKRKKPLPFNLGGSGDVGGGGGFPPSSGGGMGGHGNPGRRSGASGNGNMFSGAQYTNRTNGTVNGVQAMRQAAPPPSAVEDDDLVTDCCPFDPVDFKTVSPNFDAGMTKSVINQSYSDSWREKAVTSDMYSLPVLNMTNPQLHVLKERGPTKPVSTPKCEPKNYDLALKIAERTAVALQEYAMTGDIQTVLFNQRHLVAIKNESGDTTIHQAIIHKQTGALRNLVGVTMSFENSNKLINQFNHLRQTPLHLAVITQQYEAMDILIRSGADSSIIDRHGNTPLHLATEMADSDSVEILLSICNDTFPDVANPEINALNHDGYAPIHLAALAGSTDCIRLLYEKGADMNLWDNRSGRTPLHIAVEREDLPLTGFLILEASVDVNAPTFDGNTPLHFACSLQLVGMTALLVAAGSDPETANYENKPNSREGHTAFDLAGDNIKINKILKGEPYTSRPIIDKEKDLEMRKDKSVIDSYSSMSRSLFSTSSGDMKRMDYATRFAVGKLLDNAESGKDWVALANAMGLDGLINILKTAPSGEKAGSTVQLLDSYEVYDGTVQQLCNLLVEIDRSDVVDLIQENLTTTTDSRPTKQRPITDTYHSVDDNKRYLNSGTLESGIASMSVSHREDIV